MKRNTCGNSSRSLCGGKRRTLPFAARTRTPPARPEIAGKKFMPSSVRPSVRPSLNAFCFDSAAALINADFLRRRRRRNGDMTFVLHIACMMERSKREGGDGTRRVSTGGNRENRRRRRRRSRHHGAATPCPCSQRKDEKRFCSAM